MLFTKGKQKAAESNATKCRQRPNRLPLRNCTERVEWKCEAYTDKAKRTSEIQAVFEIHGK